MVRERRFAVFLIKGVDDFEGDDCAHGDPGSNEVELAVELR